MPQGLIECSIKVHNQRITCIAAVGETDIWFVHLCGAAVEF
jgi:hypothetical protein